MTMSAVVVAVAVLPVAGLDVGVGVGCPVTVGWGVAGVPVAVPLAVGVGVAVAPPVGGVVLAVGDGVGVQATTGSTGAAIFTRGFRCGLVNGAVLIPSGSVHRLDFAVVPPLLRLEPGLAEPYDPSAGLIRVPVS
jgi:hypothetical protein